MSTINMPITAMPNRLARRDTALLMPEATPAWWVATLLITVVVSGATLKAMPKPNIVTAGKKVVQ